MLTDTKPSGWSRTTRHTPPSSVGAARTISRPPTFRPSSALVASTSSTASSVSTIPSVSASSSGVGPASAAASCAGARPGAESAAARARMGRRRFIGLGS